MKTNLTNKQCRDYVRRHCEFRNKNNTIFAQRKKDLYVVYSYGYHWPLYVYDFETQKWYGNEDKYSVTTSRHATQTNPDVVSDWLSKDDVVVLVSRARTRR